MSAPLFANGLVGKETLRPKGRSNISYLTLELIGRGHMFGAGEMRRAP
jgi:hypothetical protein